MKVEINGVQYVPAPEQPKDSKDWTEEEARRMSSQIGLHYAVVDFSRWDGSSSATIMDPRFHQLRLKYLEAWKELEEYVDSQLQAHGRSF